MLVIIYTCDMYWYLNKIIVTDIVICNRSFMPLVIVVLKRQLEVSGLSLQTG